MSWYEQPMRWGQINIREQEPPDFDVAWWEEFWRSIHLDGITLNCGGVWAYYPTQLQDQHRSRWLGDRDLFGELVAATKRCNMRVLARIDPSLSYLDVYYRHPDWFAQDASGNLLKEPTLEDLYVTCLNGPYYWEFIPEIIREIHSLYDVDGIFTSEWDGRRRICACPRCRRMFREYSGLELPEREDPTDMAWKQWYRWQESRIEALSQHWDRTTKAIKPDSTFMGNHSDRGFVSDYADLINVDNQSRQEHTPLWFVGERGKKMRALTQGRIPYFHIFSTNSYSRHVAKPEAEHRLYIADAVLADSRPWFTIIGGIQPDKRQFEPLAAMYQWHHQNEQYFRARQSLAQVAIVYSDRDRFFPRVQARDHAFKGMYYALLRNRVAFDLVHVARMQPAILDSYKLVTLPDVAAMTEDEAANIRQFVEGGGSVIATFETGLYDEWGCRRETGLLDDLLGVRVRGSTMGSLVHSYAQLHHDHEILTGLEATAITLQATQFSPVKTSEDVDASSLTLIPPYPPYPPETAFSRTGDSGQPLLLLTANQADAGRVAYWANNVDSYFWQTNSPDLSRLLDNTVKWALAQEIDVQVYGRGLLEIHPYRQETNLQIHMVNFSNPDVWKAPVHELLLAGPFEIRARLPEGLTVSGEEAKCLVSGRRLPVQVSDGWVTTTLPDILDHEVVVFELA